ncbi:MAG: nucleotidyltransferase domain-containing protein [Ignavibacteria bacterium]|jgi:predicted nucleotidyltransferase|nr:nucleotidyltransferase domain-containing protein [Ignavibacteria bacterium]
MDKSNVIDIAKEFAKVVKKKYEYKNIILFGSYAKGNSRNESDIDIAIVFKDYDDSIDMQLELMRLRRKIDTRIEPHPFKEIDFNNMNPIVNEILKYGYEIL